MCTLYIVHKTSIFLSTKRSAHVQVVRVPYIHHVITSLDRCVGGAHRLQNVWPLRLLLWACPLSRMATAFAVPDNAATMSPAEARALFRLNKYRDSTTGFCAGYLQANVTILPKSLAKDFTEFCRANHAALPLLYRSEPGEVTTSLATGSDVR